MDVQEYKLQRIFQSEAMAGSPIRHEWKIEMIERVDRLRKRSEQQVILLGKYPKMPEWNDEIPQFLEIFNEWINRRDRAQPNRST